MTTSRVEELCFTRTRTGGGGGGASAASDEFRFCTSIPPGRTSHSTAPPPPVADGFVGGDSTPFVLILIIAALRLLLPTRGCRNLDLAERGLRSFSDGFRIEHFSRGARFSNSETAKTRPLPLSCSFLVLGCRHKRTSATHRTPPNCSRSPGTRRKMERRRIAAPEGGWEDRAVR